MIKAFIVTVSDTRTLETDVSGDRLAEMLIDLDHNVVTATGGRDGLAKVAGGDFDLVFTDLAMPEMDGWETARCLRRLLPERTAIVVLSANAIDPSRLADGERLHDEYLMKPVDLRQLLKTIHVLLNIEWIYDTQDTAAVSCPPTTSQLRLPPRDDIDELISLGEIGHVRRIQEKLNEIEHTAADYAGFVAPLRAFISAFDLKRYLATLEAMRSGHA